MKFQKKVVQKIEVVDSNGLTHSFDSEDEANLFMKREIVALFLQKIYANAKPMDVDVALAGIDQLIEDLGFTKQQQARPESSPSTRPQPAERGPAPVRIPSLHGDGDFTLFDDLPKDDFSVVTGPRQRIADSGRGFTPVSPEVRKQFLMTQSDGLTDDA